MSSAPFDIYRFSPANLYKALSNERFERNEVSRHIPARYLFNYLKNLQAKSIIVEYDYVDADYLDDFSAYYVKCFKPYNRRCKRLHFFSINITRDSLLRMIQGDASPDHEKIFRESYLGFIVARPLPNAIIGRTILKTYQHDGEQRRYKCTVDYRSNLFGIELSVRQTLAYQEQDTVLAACATVSLWCAFHRTSHLFRTPLPTPVTITRVANQVISDSRAIPSHELDVQQMVHAIRQVGLEAEVVRIKKDTPLLSLMYAHLMMGLPIILIVRVEGLDYHAITVLGYSAQKKRTLNQEVAPNEKSVPMKGLRIKEFYVHDDQIGPFANIQVRPSEVEYREGEEHIHPVVFESIWKGESGKKHLVFYPYAAIIPIYHKIRITFLDFHKWLMRLTELFYMIVEEENSLEWDIYLTTTNDYKNAIKKSGASKARLKKVLLEQYPRFIWRAVLKYNNVIILEILADATDLARSLPVFDLVWHEGATESKIRKLLEMEQPQKRLMIDLLTWPFWKFLLNNTKGQN